MEIKPSLPSIIAGFFKIAASQKTVPVGPIKNLHFFKIFKLDKFECEVFTTRASF